MMRTEAASSISMQSAYFLLKVYKNYLVKELNTQRHFFDTHTHYCMSIYMQLKKFSTESYFIIVLIRTLIVP